MSVAAQVVVIVVAGVLGLVVGSFLNVVVYRVPAGVSLLRASACPTAARCATCAGRRATFSRRRITLQLLSQIQVLQFLLGRV